MITLTNYCGEQLTVEIDDSRDALLSDFGKATLKDRYLLPGETFQSMFARVSIAYSDDSAMAQRVYDYMSRHWFMPATPVLSNGGTSRGYPISCFLNSVEDSIIGINKTWAENVMLAAKGGGIGTSYSNVRSIDEIVGAVGKTSGIIPFIKVQDSLTVAVAQGNLRRGSAAVYLDVSHPEIEEFIEIRRTTTGGDPRRRCLDIHHGVTIPDAFMKAVEDGLDWNLISPKDGSVRKTVKARDIWQKILATRLETGEPYITWSDTVNNKRPEVYKRHNLLISQSNLCNEIALHTGIDQLGNDRTAVCCLSSLNMNTMDQWYGDEQFIEDIAIFLDNVMSDFINKTDGVMGFEKARYSAMRERSIGIGIMGFHSYLQSHGIIYESAMATAINHRIFKWLKKTGEKVNERVAINRGACPDAADAGLNVRWSHMFAIAPTASISIIAAAGGATSPGVEPFVANIFTQKTLSGSFVVKNMDLDRVIERHANIRMGMFPEASKSEMERMIESFKKQAWAEVVEAEGSVQGLKFLTQDEKDCFKTAFEIDQRWVVSHAADRAPNIDQMASNNIFMLPTVHKKELHLLHMKAWRDGVPSLYYLRSKALSRGAKVSHIAGELPQPGPKHDVVMRDKGIMSDNTVEIDASRYEECLSCS